MGVRVMTVPGINIRWWIGVLFCLAAATVSATGIEIDGLITDAGGRPLAGAVVELRPVPGFWEVASAQLEGRLNDGPPAVARARSGRDGVFRIEAPEAGPWRVAARHPKYLAMSCEMKPLLGPVQLPAVALPRPIERRITTLDADGRPVAGVRVALNGRMPEASWQARFCWQPETRIGTSDEDGRLTLVGAAEEFSKIAAVSRDAFAYDTARSGTGDLSARLTTPLVAARLLDAEGRPAPGLAALATRYLALGKTGPKGEIRVPYRAGDGVSSLIFAGESGLAGWVESKEGLGDEPLVLRLPPAREVDGRVVDGASREPIAGAWVWFGDRFEPTGPRGSFRLWLPAAGEPRLEAAAAGYLKQGLAVPAESEFGELTIALAPSMALAGKVLDGGGEALAGVRVVALPDRASPIHRRRQMLDWTAAVMAVRESEAWSGAGGRFRIEGLEPGIDHQLRASRRGFAPGRVVVPARVPGESPPPVEIVLESGIAAFGVVLDDGERPVIGADVALFVPRDPAFRHGAAYFGELEPDRTTAGGAGRFELSDLGPGGYLMQVSAPGFVTLNVPGVEIAVQGQAVDLGTVQLERGVPLLGRVTDADGRGLEGVQVSADASPPSGGAERIPRTATSGPDGEFTIEGVSLTGQLDVSAWLEGYRHVILAPVVLDPEEPLIIVLEPSMTLRGRVVDARGKGAAGARVQLQRASSRGGTSTTNLAAGGDGHFVFENQAPGKATVVASSLEGIADPVELEIPAAGEPPELRLVLRPAAVVRGRVTDPAGVAVLEVRVLLEPLRPGVVDQWTESSRSAPTGAGGRFVIAAVEVGDYRLSAEHPDFEPLVETLAVEAGAGLELELVFDTRRDREGLTVSGRVIDPEGAGVDGAAVGLVGDRRRSRPVEVTSSGGGRFELQAEEPGTYALLVQHPDFASKSTAAFELGGAVVSGLEVQLAAGGSLNGRVLGLDLAQLSRLQVVASSPGLGSRGGRVSHEGSYRISNLAAGDWTVTARLGYLGRAVTEQVRLGGPGDAVEVDFAFEEAFSLGGLALRDGAPWRGARARLECQEPRVQARAAVQADGRFLFEDVVGSCRLTLRDGKQSVVVSRRQLEITADDEVVIDVATGAVSGQVLTAGELVPVAGATVGLHLPGAGPGLPPAGSVSTGATGRFELRPVSQGPWRLRVTAAGFVAVERTVEASSDELRILLTPATPVIMTVHDARGDVPRQVHVAVLDAGRQAIASLYYRPDATGRVLLDTLPAGTWTVHVSAEQAKAEVELKVPGEPVRVVLGE